MMTASRSSAVEHGGGARIGRTVERAAGRRGIGDRRQHGARRRSDEVDVLTPHEAGADDADANGRGLGCGHGASLRRCGCAGPNRAYGTMRAALQDTFHSAARATSPSVGESMFHSTGHRFANRTKSVRVSTATKPQLDSVVDDDLAPCEDVSTGCRAAAIECHVQQARRRAHIRGESHGHSPIDAPRPNRRVGARSNRACRHRLRRRRHPGEHRHRGSIGEQPRHDQRGDQPAGGDAELLLRRRAAQGAPRGRRHRLHRRAVPGEPARSRRGPLPARPGRRHRHRPAGRLGAELDVRAHRRRGRDLRVRRCRPRVQVDRRGIGRPVRAVP